MSNNTSLEKFNPNQLAAIIGADAMTETNDVFSGGISTGGLPVVSIRGNRFRLRLDGEETVLPDLKLNVHLVTARPNVSKALYKGAYDPNATDKKPACSSADGVYPDSTVEEPESSTCQNCQNNAWGSRITESGGKGKKCSDYKLIILALTAKPDTAFSLRVPAASLKGFNSYIQKLKLAGVPANAAITQISLGNEEFPMVLFDFAGTVETAAAYEEVKALSETVEVLNAVKIAPRAQAALPAADPVPTVTAQQPVAIPEPAPEPAAPAAPSLTDLLGTTKKTPKKKAEPVVEPTPEPVAAEVPAEAEPVTGLDQIFAKMNAKKTK